MTDRGPNHNTQGQHERLVVVGDDGPGDESVEGRAREARARLRASRGTDNPTPTPAPVETDDGSAVPLLELSADGLTAGMALLGFDYRYNSRTARPELRQAGTRWQPFDDLQEADLRERFRQEFESEDERSHERKPWDMSDARWRLTLNAALHRRRVDPFREWLYRLPAWDGEPRLDALLSTCFSLAPGTHPALAAWASRSVLMAAVWRALEPGTKHDEMVVLVGPQGSGKSTFYAALLPPEHRAEWFGDGLDMSANAQRRVEATLGKVIVEVAEMAGRSRADLEGWKAFLTRVDDSLRLAYRRNPETRPRRFVAVATTNEITVLPDDPSGNRRFVPVEVADGNVRELAPYFMAHRFQIWAEALHRVRLREPARLPDTLTAVAEAAAERHRDANDTLENIIHMVYPTLKRTFTVHDAAATARLAKEGRIVDKRTEMAVAKVLKRMGCTRRRTSQDGVRQWTWTKPGA